MFSLSQGSAENTPANRGPDSHCLSETCWIKFSCPSNFPGKVDSTLDCFIFFKWRYKISSSLGFTDIREGKIRWETHSTLLLKSECRALDSHWNQGRAGGKQGAN